MGFDVFGPPFTSVVVFWEATPSVPQTIMSARFRSTINPGSNASVAPEIGCGPIPQLLPVQPQEGLECHLLDGPQDTQGRITQFSEKRPISLYPKP